MRLFQRTFFSSFILVASVGLAGCSQKFNHVNETVKVAFFGDADVALKSNEVNTLPYASIYARVDNGPKAFMVLALAEAKPTFDNNSKNLPLQLKWLSSDSGMLVTEHGRLVKSLNLPQGNLLNTHSLSADPLLLGLHLPNTPTKWQRTIDWQPGYHFGYQLDSTFIRQNNDVVIINDNPVQTLHFIEEVTVNSLSIRYRNNFWIHPTTGKVLKSKQKLAPGLPFVEMTLLKPYS